MLELIFLDARNFQIKDFAFSKNNTIIFDSLVPNSSIFNVYKNNLNVSSGDLVITRGNSKQYIGIVDSVSVSNNISKITTYHFSKKLSISFVSEAKVNINLGDFIKEIITNNLIKSSDVLQNLTYLEVENKSTLIGSVSINSNSASNILDVISSILKAYELVINYKATYSINGNLKGIKITIEDVSKELVIKESENFITNAEIVDGKVGAVNKITYFANSNNILYKDTRNYYLLKDGTITQDSSNVNRITPVVNYADFYQDEDIFYDKNGIVTENLGESLLAKAKTKFSATNYNHYIKFIINQNNLINISKLNLGDRVMFISNKGKAYKTIISQIKFTNSTQVEIELGLNRITLTDKLKMKGE